MVKHFTLSNPPSTDIITDVATELGVASAFVEKDWYAVQLIQKITELEINNAELIFGGGTCLSKGYDLIKRFSEDLDFVLSSSNTLNRTSLSTIKNQISEILNAPFSLQGGITARDNNKFFKYDIAFPKNETHSALRPVLQLEVSYKPSLLPYETKPIQSLISKLMNYQPETQIQCIPPIETAGNKLSALAWRILNESTDQTVIRHLHDLAILEGIIAENTGDFKAVLIHSLNQDKQNRGNTYLEDLSNQEILSKLLTTLDTKKYEENYSNFVLSMSYEADTNKISFSDAIDRLCRIVDIV